MSTHDERPTREVRFTVDGEPAPSEAVALERARKRASLQGRAEVWMRSGAWVLLLARWQNGEQDFPRKRSDKAA